MHAQSLLGGKVHPLTSNSDRSSQQQKDQPTPISATGGVCPFVANPMPDCHCAQLTSMRIPQILERCGGGYEQCELFFRRRFGKPLTDRGNSPHHPIMDEEGP